MGISKHQYNADEKRGFRDAAYVVGAGTVLLALLVAALYSLLA